MVQVTELLVFGRYKCYQIFYMLITALKRPDCGLAFCFQSFQSNTSRPVTCIVGPLVRGVGLCSSISDTYKDPFATCARWVQEGCPYFRQELNIRAAMPRVMLAYNLTLLRVFGELLAIFELGSKSNKYSLRFEATIETLPNFGRTLRWALRWCLQL